MPTFVLCVRNVQKGEFGDDVGPLRHLIVPGEASPIPDHAVSRTDWLEALLHSRMDDSVDRQLQLPSEVVVLVHGHSAGLAENLWRQRRLQADLDGLGFRGVVVGFDWPCPQAALHQLEDRDKAKQAAARLCDDGIRLLATQQARGCGVPVHVLCHSAGAYVVREACDDADERSGIANHNWTVGQVALIGADVSSGTMKAGDSKSAALYRHCYRLTNYQTPQDGVLKLSNLGRAGVGPRIGRVGLPASVPAHAVNVDCGAYFAGKKPDGSTFVGPFSHAWQIGDALFAADLLYTLRGEIDRNYVPTRKRTASGGLELGR